MPEKILFLCKKVAVFTAGNCKYGSELTGFCTAEDGDAALSARGRLKINAARSIYSEKFIKIECFD